MQEIQLIKILIVDYHSVVGSGVAAILEGYSGFDVVGQAERGEESLRLIEQHRPDMVIIDVDLPGEISGIDVVHAIRRNVPQAHILILTNLLEETIVHAALQAGVIGYLLKNTSAQDFVRAVRAADRGVPTLSPEVMQLIIHGNSMPSRNGSKLTPREQQVLELVARGWNNGEIADWLSISLSTVQFHVSNILNKLGANNRIEAAAFAIRHKLTD